MPTIQTSLRDGAVRLRVKKDGTLVNEQDWHFRIRADSLSQGREEILLNTPDVPKFGKAYGQYGMMLKGCDANFLDEDPLLWDCVYNLSNQVEEGESTNPTTGEPQIGDPTLWVPVIELGFEDYEEVFFSSLEATSLDEIDQRIVFLVGPGRSELPLRLPDGTLDTVTNIGTAPEGTAYNAYRWQNSAGDAYDSGFVRQKRIITRKFVQFERITGPLAVTLDQIEERNDTLNASEFLRRPPRTLKLSVDAVSAGFYYGMRCWRVDYTMAYKKTDWRLKKLDVGWMYKEGQPDGSVKKIPFLDDSDPPNNIIGPLNGRGVPMTSADPDIPPQPAIRAHKEFESLNFASFLRLE